MTSEDEGVYKLREIQWGGHPIRVLSQNLNGPCPLIAIGNALLLKRLIEIPSSMKEIPSQTLLTMIVDYMVKRQNEADGQNVDVDVVFVAQHHLQTGLDINIRFNGPTDVEVTKETAVFGMLGLRLVHGWLPDIDEDPEVYAAVHDLTYNDAVEKAVGDDDKARVIKNFLQETASQLTPRGIRAVRDVLADDEVAVFFRNNHFNTVMRHHGDLLVLLTDEGYRHTSSVWQELVDVAGNGTMFNSFFEPLFATTPLDFPSIPADNEAEVAPQGDPPAPMDDFALAKSLQEQEDHLHAVRLQRESQARATAPPAAVAAPQTAPHNPPVQRPQATGAPSAPHGPASVPRHVPPQSSCSIF